MVFFLFSQNIGLEISCSLSLQACKDVSMSIETLFVSKHIFLH